MLIQPSQIFEYSREYQKTRVFTLAESVSDKINDIVYNVEDVTKWLIFLTSFLFFFGATEKKWTQTDHKHELFDK